MADININRINRKRKSKPFWPWLLGLAVLLLLIWVLAEMTPDPETRELGAQEPYPVVTERVAIAPAGREIDAFVSYVREDEVRDELGGNRIVTSEALMRLSFALEQLATDDQAYLQQIDDIRTNATQLQAEPAPTGQRQADFAYSAFSSVVQVLDQLRQERFSEATPEVEDVQQQLARLGPTEPLAAQQQEVSSFFDSAADAVEKMQEANP